MLELDAGTLALLFLAAFAAGWLDAVGGGGGMILLPALLLVLPTNLAAQALGTNKLASSLGTATAAIAYSRNEKIKSGFAAIAMVLAFIGAVYGASLANQISGQTIQKVVFTILILVWFFNLQIFQNLRKTHVARLQKRFWIFAFIVGIYDGMVGPGTGAFLLTALVLWQGLTFLQASPYAKLINFSTNLGAIVIFAISGNINWWLGIALAIFNIAGARLGARFAIRSGSEFIRRFLLVIVAILIARLGITIWG